MCCRFVAFADDIYRKKWTISLVLWLILFSLGWLIGVLGPSLPDLQHLANVSLHEISFVLTSLGVGRCVGAIILGFLYDRVEKHIFIIYTGLSFLAGVSITAIPVSCNFYLYISMALLTGFAFGGITCGNTTLLTALWKKQGRPFFHAAHFSYALGGVIAPLAAAPFLVSYGATTSNMTVINSTSSKLPDTAKYLSTSDVTDVYTITVASKTIAINKLLIPFAICGVCLLFCVTFFLIFYFCHYPTKAEEAITENDSDVISRTKLPPYFSYRFFAILLFLRFLYFPIEYIQQSYLVTFVEREFHWSKFHSTMLNSILWASLGFGRLVGIVASRRLNPTTILYIAFGGILVGTTIQFLAGWLDHGYLLWIGTPVSNIFASVCSPSLILWINENLLPVSGRVSALFAVVTSVSTFTAPLYVGILIDNLSPMWYVYCQYLHCSMALIIFTILVLAIKFVTREVIQADLRQEPLLNNEV